MLGALNDGIAKSIVLITDGQAAGSPCTATRPPPRRRRHRRHPHRPDRNRHRQRRERVEPRDLGLPASYYQAGTPGPIDTTKLIGDLGAAVSMPASFTVRRRSARLHRLGAEHQHGHRHARRGHARVDGHAARLRLRHLRLPRHAQRWRRVRLAERGRGHDGTLRHGRHRHRDRAGRRSIDVLPCGGTPIAATTCTGGTLHRSRHAGRDRVLRQHAPPAGTAVVLAGLNAPAPPAGTCPGFASHTTGAQFDIRPLAAGRNAPAHDPARRARQPALVPDRRLHRHQPAVHHGDPVALEPRAERDVRQRWRASGPLVGAPAERPAHRLIPGPRVRARAVHRQPLAARERRRGDRLPRAVRPDSTA